MASIDFVLSSLGLTGTGFSYGTGLDHDEKGVARDMYDFLQQVTLYPEADVASEQCTMKLALVVVADQRKH